MINKLLTTEFIVIFLLSAIILGCLTKNIYKYHYDNNRPQVFPFRCEFLLTHFRGDCQIEYFPSNYIMNLNKTILHQGRKITQISCFVSGRGKSEISSQTSKLYSINSKF